MEKGYENKIFQFNKALSLLLYGFVSVTLVFLNKRIFVGNFSYPLFTTWIQQVCGMICYLIAYVVLKSIFGIDHLISRPSIQYEKIKDTLPMSLSCTIFILLSNLCLKYVPMSSYAITRSLTLFFNIVFSILILKQQISNICIFGCGIVIMGFIIGSLDSSTLGLYGILAGATSSFFQSIYTVQIKSVSKKINDEFQVYWYNAFTTSFLAVVPIFIFGEYNAFIELSTLDFGEFTINFGPILISGILNFFLGIIVIWCIHTTSPIAYNLTGYVKSGIQTLIGVLLNNEELKFSTILGLVMTIGGSAIYSFANLIKLTPNKNVNSNESCHIIFEQQQPIQQENYYEHDSTLSGASSLEYDSNKKFQMNDNFYENEHSNLSINCDQLIKNSKYRKISQIGSLDESLTN
ncbi:nucleotide sugar transporter like integral membrane with 9 transmembrane domains [Cryptosporidium sp. chipmunk genotype I]|uniref:nucleotide sugar transporter like integral membrane with 9 transmembrane domains n=1 Tax=Cryptosporidium sp. chipmunk genotype I TaxID=1280935 RepID=UPI003519F2C8|nr:nucleotide sugar transporter like integral membrane with 9 transmembrane domains [Cryptosporidium sp. chipmunk genotype I]